MSGMVARRNEPGFWVGPITWGRIKRKRPPRCDDCWLNVYEQGRSDGWITRATWLRRNGEKGPWGDERVVTNLCGDHRQEWLDWTPGQLELGA
jgi:hypothetical protein